MTIIYYGTNPTDGDQGTVAVGTGATTGKGLEIKIDNSKYLDEGQIYKDLRRLMVYIQQKRLITT